MNERLMNRRGALQLGTCAALALSPAVRLLAADESRTFRIGACDWSLGKRQDVAALEFAKELGIDGVQVSFGPVGVKYDLRSAQVRRAYSEACQRLKVHIASLALGKLNQKPYASDPDAEQWVSDCIAVMQEMGQKIALIPFFGAGDILNDPQAQRAVVRRLKKAAPIAEKAGVILGLETWLDADQHLRILDAVGSPAVQVYYDVANMQRRGYDIYREIRQLGRDRICEVHAKENGFLLGQGKVDFIKVSEAFNDIGWSGWLVIEGATVPGKSIAACYRLNQEYLRSVFPT
jgi:sugar phosphate isomerase/epimerase